MFNTCVICVGRDLLNMIKYDLPALLRNGRKSLRLWYSSLGGDFGNEEMTTSSIKKWHDCELGWVF